MSAFVVGFALFSRRGLAAISTSKQKPPRGRGG
jgi:hypothetical protein